MPEKRVDDQPFVVETAPVTFAPPAKALRRSAPYDP